MHTLTPAHSGFHICSCTQTHTDTPRQAKAMSDFTLHHHHNSCFQEGGAGGGASAFQSSWGWVTRSSVPMLQLGAADAHVEGCCRSLPSHCCLGREASCAPTEPQHILVWCSLSRGQVTHASDYGWESKAWESGLPRVPQQSQAKLHLRPQSGWLRLLLDFFLHLAVLHNLDPTFFFSPVVLYPEEVPLFQLHSFLAVPRTCSHVSHWLYPSCASAWDALLSPPLTGFGRFTLPPGPKTNDASSRKPTRTS